MKRSKGFTLVEVLIAAVILFATLSLSAMSIQSLRQNSAQAEKVIKTLKPARMIALEIQQQIRSQGRQAQDSISGSGVLEDVSYLWQADAVQKGSAPPQLDVDRGTTIIPPDRFVLYQVDLQLTREGRTEELQYKELAWLALGI